jgi:hypothetical protein
MITALLSFAAGAIVGVMVATLLWASVEDIEVRAARAHHTGSDK